MKQHSVHFLCKNNDKLLKDFILDLASENKCNVKKLAWKSKYNSYVVYDYEPFCSDGFDIEVIIEGDIGSVHYVEYLVNKRLKDLETIKKMIYST